MHDTHHIHSMRNQKHLVGVFKTRKPDLYPVSGSGCRTIGLRLIVHAGSGGEVDVKRSGRIVPRYGGVYILGALLRCLGGFDESISIY